MANGFYDEYQNELFEELMVQYEIQQERQELLRRVEEEEDFLDEDGVF
jgi:hypothetical protein